RRDLAPASLSRTAPSPKLRCSSCSSHPFCALAFARFCRSSSAHEEGPPCFGVGAPCSRTSRLLGLDSWLPSSDSCTSLDLNLAHQPLRSLQWSGIFSCFLVAGPIGAGAFSSKQWLAESSSRASQ